jgi:hypothetical protein
MKSICNFEPLAAERADEDRKAVAKVNKSSVVTILLLAVIVGAIGLAWVQLMAPASSLIALGVKRYTNISATVSLTNQTRVEVNYFFKVERKDKDGWPRYQTEMPLGFRSDGQSGALSPGEFRTLPVQVTVYAPPCPWRVSVFCCKSQNTNTIRFRAGLLLARLHIPRLAKGMWGNIKAIQISSPEMPQ